MRINYRGILRGDSRDTVLTTACNPRAADAARSRNIHNVAQHNAPIYDARQPLANSLGPNAAIYHPPLAKMFHVFSSEDNLSQVELDIDIELLVKGLCRELAKESVVDEDTYMNVVEKYLTRVFFPWARFHKKYRLVRNGKCEVELDFAVTCLTPYGEEAILLAGEAKYREGNGGSGPSQALYGYRRVCINPSVSENICLDGCVLA